MSNEINEQAQQNGLQRVFQAVSQPAASFISGSARLMVYGTAVAAIAQIATGNGEAANTLITASPALATFFAAVSGDILAGLIERVAYNDDLSDEDIQRLLVQALEDSGLTQTLTEQEFYRATRILEGRREAEYAAVTARLDEILSRLEKMPDEVDGAALQPYLSLVGRQTGRLLLGPLDPGGREKLRVDLDKVFININAGHQLLDLRPGPEPNLTIFKQYSAALAHIYYNRQLVLLGDPGSGKSTIMRFLAHQLAAVDLNQPDRQTDALHWQQKQTVSQSFSRNLDEIPTDTDPFVDRYQLKQVRGAPEKDSEQIEKRWQGETPIPIYVQLRDFASSTFELSAPTALWQFIEQRLAAEEMETTLPALKARALRGGVIFLLDGVDEVPPQQRPAIWQAINALWESPFGENRWVVTCRVLSFSEQEAPFGVPVRTLQTLTNEQIDSFIENWYGALRMAGELEPGEAKILAQQLSAASRREKLHPLAENPMLLTIMALVQTYYGTLPDERVKLYQACVEVLLLRWQSRKELSAAAGTANLLAQLGTTKEKLEQLLWEIAWQAHNEALDEQETADIAESEILAIARQPQYLGDIVKAAQFLEYTETRAHLLIARGGTDNRSYAFPHRTFQEYLAACYLASVRRFPRQVPKLAAEGDPWREVLNLAAGILVYNRQNWETVLLGLERMEPEDTPDQDDQSCWRQVWLAGEMATVVGRDTMENDPEMGQDILAALQKNLGQLLEVGALEAAQRAAAGEALGRLGDPRSGVCELEPPLIPISGGSFLMGEAKYNVTVEQPFAIARYPVTHAQYEQFIAAGGYTEKWQDCWTKAGWEWREDRNRQAPWGWTNPDYALSNQPVIGVAWYEAAAYAAWLGRTTGKPYRLPTEAEWERAARHTDGRQFPWGDQWDANRANSEETNWGRPTVVGCFPGGNAECGAADMVGNVWEWCQTRWRNEEGQDYPQPYQSDDGRERLKGGDGVWRVLKGGAFYSEAPGCALRFRGGPGYDHPFGFRLVVSPFFL